MTIFSIVYNGYGRFIPQWNKFLDNQTVKVDKMVILGKDHSADLTFLKENNIRYYEVDSDVMGVLRNKGIEEVKTDWWFYFAIDDELMPEATETIMSYNGDAVSITFNVLEDGRLTIDQSSPYFKTVEDLKNWKTMWGGYTAVYKNKDLRFREDLEVPNITFHLDMFNKGLKVVKTDEPLIVHLRRKDSHHFKSKEDGSRNKIVKTIQKEIDKTIESLLIEVEALDTYERLEIRDSVENKVFKQGDRFKVSENRLKVLLGDNEHNQVFVKKI